MAAPAATAQLRTVALVAGGSGLVGGALLPLLIAEPDVSRVIAISRRPLIYDHPRIANRIVPFDALEQALEGTRADIAFCCLGTTLRAAGSQQAFRAVDHDHVVAYARAAHRAGVRRFVMVSAVGADPRSRNFYLRTKGEAENQVAQLGFTSLDIVQPSLLLGWRKELRPLEAVGMVLLPLVGPLLLGDAQRYRAVSASTVAAALVSLIRSQRRGITRYTHRAIEELARTKRR